MIEVLVKSQEDFFDISMRYNVLNIRNLPFTFHSKYMYQN